MKLLQIVTLALVLTHSAHSFAESVDLQSSKVIWSGSKVVGDTHTGHIKIKSAVVNFDKETPLSGQVTLDMPSITNTDLTDAKWNGKLVGHLNSPDFFDTAKFKTANLKINKITKLNKDTYNLIGNLTIKSTTLPVTLKSSLVKKNV